MEILNKSKLNILFASVIMFAVILCCSSQVKAAQDGDFTYTISDGEAEITGYTGNGGTVTIPGTLGGLPVTDIGDRAFWDCDRLTGITIPEGVTSIGNYAFFSCEGLTSITIPQGVTRIGEYAFSQCNGLTSITISPGVIGISCNAFAACTNLTAITVAEDNLTYASINGVLFNKAGNTLLACPGGLTNIVIPQEVTSIDKYAFYGCRGLTSIALPPGVNDIGEYAFGGCEGLTSITITSGVTSIASHTFSFTGLTSITIPPGVSSIGDYAFSGCEDLTSITIPQGVASIGEYAFYSSTGLTSIAIPSGVTSISRGTFSSCTGLTSVTIPSSVTIIGNYAFQECSNLTSITIPEGVTSIGKRAFNGCTGLTGITFNSATTAIDDTEYSIPAATKIIGYDPSTAKDYAAKYGREFEDIENKYGDFKYAISDGEAEITGYTGSGGDVTIPSTLGGVNVTSIGDSAFKHCTGITGITIPEGVTSIGREVFYDCTDLTSITISQSVTSIGEDAFLECTNLTAISVDNNNLIYMSKDGVLFNKAGTTLMACPAGLTSITIPQEVNSIGQGAFQYCKGLTSISIPPAVTSIGDWAFHHCEGLMSISIPPAVTNIGSYAFNNCEALTSITIPQGVTSIGSGAFSNCKKLTVITVDDGNSTYVSKDGVLFNKAGTIFMACPAGLTSITIPQEVTSIDECAFSGCLGLTSITIPEKVTSIGKGAFSSCIGLTSINIPQGVASISDSTFFGCIGLTSITIPEGVTSIGGSAFFGCRSLTNITIPQGVTGIGSRAFLYCTGLTSITIPEAVISIGENAFSGCTGLTSIKFNSEKTMIFDNADTIPATTKIIGYSPSAAKEYAAKYGRTFQIIDAPSGGGGSHSGGGGSNSPAANGVNILINGESLNEGIMTITKEGTRTIATVTFDDKELEQMLTQAGNNTVVIPVNNDADAVIGELNGQMIKNMEYKQVTAVLKTQNASYNLSPRQINIDAVAAQLGVEPKDIKVQIQIAKPNTEMLKVVEKSAKNGEFIIVAPAVEFSVKCTCGDKTVELSRFDSYVQRTVAIPEGANPNQITTAVVVEQDGTVRHVPTRLVQIDNQYFAQINSLTNSAYSVISHPIEFKDVDKHWAKKEINDMGSRMVVSGVSKENYEPDRDITRAEFAAILVQALGLKPGNDQGTFSDVQGSDWFSGAIQTASQYQIISGYGNGKFGPTDKITREQAITMIAKAMNITGLKAEFREEDGEKILAGFTDAGKTAEYARSSMIACVKTGLITGKVGNVLAPKDNITRAEVALVVQKLLQKSNLI